MIEPHAGYPAGLPRLTTLDLTGKLTGGRCVLRIRTNMECYYDQAFIAVRDRQAEHSLRVTTLPVARAVLGHRGYTREVSPDGRQPLVYDYDYVDPAPLARMSGKLTRYGDVACLLQADDDRFCVVGPGDEARLEFEAAGLPPLPAGWTRAYVLAGVRLLQGRRPVHGDQRHGRALALAGHARLPVRCRCHPACHAGLRRLSPRVPDAPGGWSRAAPGSTLRVIGRFAVAGHWSRGKHGNQTALHEAVKGPGWGDRTMLEPRVDVSRVDQLGGRGGLEPDEALAADQRVVSRPSDQQGVAEPAMLPGRAGPCLNHVMAAMAAIERDRYGRRHVRVDLDVRAGLAAEDDDLEQRVRRRLDQVRNTVDRDHDFLAAGDGRVSHLRNLDVVGAMIGSWQRRHHQDVVIDQVDCAGVTGATVSVHGSQADGRCGGRAARLRKHLVLKCIRTT